MTHKSKDDVRLIVARLKPLPDSPTIIRRLTAPPPAPQLLMRHSIPTGDAAQIIERALALLLKQVQRRKFGLLSSPKAG